ncbi:unnamed protein product [Blumeria hordei]|uniref:tRNA wybutosine-synthesizing protein 4 n=1 Tax=Blumeria hordei TaxID=2867405 RepID=A0A383V062_BLUHO|nr:unnamed protein product [Blumeria hordei]
MRDQMNIPNRNSNVQAQDERVMSTNNSSIVSKRSVERIYFPDESHYFRYFVKKPQRRSPLINRGYWLRMKAIDHTVGAFLKKNSEKKKVLINLGCGYDPLPWQCLAKYSAFCKGVVFIDVDHRDLIIRKRTIVQQCPELHSALTNTASSENNILLRSDQYFQVGCDLRELTLLEEVLATIFERNNCSVLFVAEVSLTYMDVSAANALIKWASSFPDAGFCLLEQLLPHGIEHPFARAMIKHFEKLETPLGSVNRYPAAKSQQDRFRVMGWKNVEVLNLWELWGSSSFLTPDERKSLDLIEPFDEWEEFALFANHYFLLNASTSEPVKARCVPWQVENILDDSAWNVAYSVPNIQVARRFAASMFVKSQDRGKDRIALFGGMEQARMNSREEYTCLKQDSLAPGPQNSDVPSCRMCHTITDLGESGALLVGGRTSPDAGLADCWIYHKWLDYWERVDTLPWPLYRHQAISIGSEFVLVSTGWINSFTISNSFLLWSRKLGWVKCNFCQNKPHPVSGSVLFKFPGDQTLKPRGILAGGIGTDGVVMDDIWHWTLTDISSGEPNLFFCKMEKNPKLSRFGASIVIHHGQIYLLGGIVQGQLLSCEDEIIRLQVEKDYLISPCTILQKSQLNPWPMLIGSSAFSTGNSMVILGGSAVCFSFGTFSNKSCFTLSPASVADPEQWRFLHKIDVKNSSKSTISQKTMRHRGLMKISRTKIQSKTHFEEIISVGKPVILEGLDIGSCTSKWTTEYLTCAIGEEREKVIVHEATTPHMDFITKNFTYSKRTFGKFMNEIECGGSLYLRSLSSEQPTANPANFSKDFSSLSSDFSLPPELSFVTENQHSSPLRISGSAIMWLHYDTLANVLCQIKGERRLVLFHPLDFKYFDLKPGASSSSVNVFQHLEEETIDGPQPFEAILSPGDVLFIPPFWLHTAAPISNISVAVNVFFRNFLHGYANGKDVYGNRDFQAYEKGRENLSKILTSFDKIPIEARSFYMERLLEEFQQKVSCSYTRHDS